MVFLRERILDGVKDGVGDRTGMLDEGVGFRDLDRNKAVINPENHERLPWRVLFKVRKHAAHAFGGNLAVREAQTDELPGELRGLFAGTH